MTWFNFKQFVRGKDVELTKRNSHSFFFEGSSCLWHGFLLILKPIIHIVRNDSNRNRNVDTLLSISPCHLIFSLLRLIRDHGVDVLVTSLIQYGGSFDEVSGNTVNVQRNWGAIPSARAKPVGRYCTQFRGTYNSFTRYLIKRSTVLTLWSSKWLTSWEVIFFCY